MVDYIFIPVSHLNESQQKYLGKDSNDYFIAINYKGKSTIHFVNIHSVSHNQSLLSKLRSRDYTDMNLVNNFITRLIINEQEALESLKPLETIFDFDKPKWRTL